MKTEASSPSPPQDIFTLARQWLHECDTCHSDHRFASSQSPLPSRVLDVGNSTDEEIRLYESNEGRGKYAVLSHTWGIAQPLILTFESYPTFSRGIPLGVMDLTFRHAIIVTRRLGIQYLWVDALCIIQDSREDWQRESQRMESIFAMAYCRISSISAGNTQEGFLRPSIQETPLYSSIKNNEDFRRDVEQSLQASRAWILPERTLSTRTIYFTNKGIYWECGSTIRREYSDQINEPQDLISSSRFPMNSTHLFRDCQCQTFEDIFEKYSCLRLTKSTDRPVAISTMERAMARFYRTQSLFGIVLRFFHKSLLWQPFMRLEQPKFQNIPTSSWMSYDHRIYYGIICMDGLEWNEDVQIVSRTETGTANRTMRQYILAGPLVRIHPGCRTERSSHMAWEMKDRNGALVGCIIYDQEAINEDKVGCIVIAEGSAGWKEFARVSWREDFPPGRFSYCLLVEGTRVENVSFETYRRVGIGTIHNGSLLLNERRPTISLS
ncbi:HET-domain-containing protein [Lepidopterella palustris CBS 459.81]|uniref:HET-domain-containing protein n=1 Tax=Lepidopterella palustris CBS 459.81 TaxID=1314670 RepID=A0A8E2JFZ5_9PEZI|nr:HET-domain-containing protein [Lepidopterella palustris CBS 459.81]